MKNMYCCRVAIVDAPNNNGRTHELTNIITVVADISDAINQHKVYVEFEGDNMSPTVDADRVCAIVTAIEIIECDVLCNIRILKTPHGAILQALLDDEVDVALNMMSIGDAQHIHKILKFMTTYPYKVTTPLRPVRDDE